MSKNLIIYKSHWELIEQLSIEQVGKLMKGIGKFCNAEQVIFDDPLLIGIWMVMKRDFVLQAENYEKKKDANRKNGKLGGRPKQTEHNPQNPTGYLETHNNPQNLKDKDKEKDKEKDIERDKEKEKMLAVYTAPFIPEIENTEVDYMIDETDIELTRPMLERIIDKFISVDSRFKFQSVMSEINEDYGGFDNLIELYLPNDTTAQQNYKNKKQQYQNGIYA